MFVLYPGSTLHNTCFYHVTVRINQITRGRQMKRTLGDETIPGEDHFNDLPADLISCILTFLQPPPPSQPAGSAFLRELQHFKLALHLSHVSRHQHYLFWASYPDARLSRLFQQAGADGVLTCMKNLQTLATIASFNSAYEHLVSTSFNEKTRVYLYSLAGQMGPAATGRSKADALLHRIIHSSEYKECPSSVKYIQTHYALLTEELKMTLALALLSLNPYSDKKAVTLGRPDGKSQFEDIYFYGELGEEEEKEETSFYEIKTRVGTRLDLRRLHRLTASVRVSPTSLPLQLYTISNFDGGDLFGTWNRKATLTKLVRRLEVSRSFRDAVDSCYKALRAINDPVSEKSRKKGREEEKVWKKRVERLNKGRRI
jgi:hypothetical protein